MTVFHVRNSVPAQFKCGYCFNKKGKVFVTYFKKFLAILFLEVDKNN